MGHSSLKMITDKYFSYIPNMTHHDGSKFIMGLKMFAAQIKQSGIWWEKTGLLGKLIS